MLFRSMEQPYIKGVAETAALDFYYDKYRIPEDYLTIANELVVEFDLDKICETDKDSLFSQVMVNSEYTMINSEYRANAFQRDKVHSNFLLHFWPQIFQHMSCNKFDLKHKRGVEVKLALFKKFFDEPLTSLKQIMLSIGATKRDLLYKFYYDGNLYPADPMDI